MGASIVRRGAGCEIGKAADLADSTASLKQDLAGRKAELVF
jgi:hypothetical protein